MLLSRITSNQTSNRGVRLETRNAAQVIQQAMFWALRTAETHDIPSVSSDYRVSSKQKLPIESGCSERVREISEYP